VPCASPLFAIAQAPPPPPAWIPACGTFQFLFSAPAAAAAVSFFKEMSVHLKLGFYFCNS
jgi:hypothetical protein